MPRTTDVGRSGAVQPAPRGASRRRPGAGRLYWIDSVRIALTALVVAHHCAVTYGNIPIWFYNEAPHDGSALVLDAFVVVNQTWFMGLFFFISGYFARGSLARRGPAAFARERLLRLGLPLLGFVLVVGPLAGLHSWLVDPERTGYLRHYLLTLDAGPAWFLEVLLVLSLAYAGCRVVRRFVVDRPPPGAGVGRRVVAGQPLGLVVLMAACGAIWRLVVPDGTYWPVIGLPTPSFLPQYAMMFAAGVLAARHRWLERMPASFAWIGGSAAAASLVLLAFGMSSTDPGIGALVGGIAAAGAGVGLSVVMLVLVRSLAPGTGPVRRFLSANAFAVYVIHPAILVGLALLLQAFVVPALAKGAALLALSLPACWLLAASLRKVPAIERVL